MRKNLRRFAVFASGRGTNLENIIRHVRAGKIQAELAMVFSDNPKALALKKARRHGIKRLYLLRESFPSKETFEAEILRNLQQEKVNFMVLAGYMRIVGPTLLRAFPQKILNIHPALLPAFKGAQAIRDAYDHGVKITGVTVHFVDEKVDHGPIILQKEVRIDPKDSYQDVERKIHSAEYQLYPQAIQFFAKGRLKIRKRKVWILPR